MAGTPGFILAPGTVEDCFYLTVDALNLADKWRLPVILLLDQALCQNTVTSPPFDLNRVHLDRGKLLTPEQLAALTAYKYYESTPDGIPPTSLPGSPARSPR